MSTFVVSQGFGKKIDCVDQYKPQLKLLETLAKKGHYYPMLALKELKKLTTGLIGKNNVYIPNNIKSDTFQDFEVYLPGIKASLTRKSDDTYIVSQLIVSNGWDELDSVQGEKPGVYHIKVEDLGRYVKKFSTSDTIRANDARAVAIADATYINVETAAKKAVKYLKQSDVVNKADIADGGGFDLIYTPGNKRLGKRAYDPKSINNPTVSASILAKAMIAAKDQERVAWVSEFGGGVVFTHAMDIVAHQNIKLKNHYAVMYKPPGHHDDAVRLAHQLGFKLQRKFITPGFISGVDNLKSRHRRASNSKDSAYTKGNFWKDVSLGAAAATFAGAGTVFGIGGAVIGIKLIATKGIAELGFWGMGGLVTGAGGLLIQGKKGASDVGHKYIGNK